MSSPLRTPLAMVLDGVAAWPDRDVLTFAEVRPDGGFAEEIRTYGDLLSQARMMAGALAAEGMGGGDAFAIIMRNHPQFVDAMVASEIAGTVFVPIDPRTRGDKLVYMLRFAECRGAVVTADVAAHLRTLLDGLPRLRWVWVIDADEDDGPFRPLSSILAAAEPATAATPRPLTDTMQMLYTSGTTGDPKAIRATYARYAGVAALNGVIGLRPDDRPYTGLSLTHANAQLITLGNALSMGLRLVVSRQFTKSRLWDIVRRHGCTTFTLLGGMATAIFAEPENPNDRAHPVRQVLSAGMPAALWPAFEERFGLKVFEFFGAAEGGLTLNPPGEGPVGSIGRAPAGTVCAILDETGAECAPGAPGEICFRNADGSVAPVAYHNDEAASRRKTCDGWFHSGDIGYKDAAGWVWFSHRAGASVRRNGDFINVAQIETAIAAMPGVTDAYVYGVATIANAPGEKEVVAAIVPAPRAAFDPRGVFDHCASWLGPSSTPSFVQLVDEIPKTASEKPQDRYLVAMLGDSAAKLFDRNGPATLQLIERTSP